MSSTRYQSPGSDPDDANERFLSDPAFAGINIGLYSICIAARQRTLQQTRAMVWLHNFARLMQVTADQLCAELDFTRTEIRHALRLEGCRMRKTFKPADLLTGQLVTADLTIPTQIFVEASGRRRQVFATLNSETGLLSLRLGGLRRQKTYALADLIVWGPQLQLALA